MNWQQLIQTFGYPLVALGIGLESMGIPVPGETFLLIGAAISANGQLNIGLVIFCAALGSVVGNHIAYYLASRYGQDILNRVTHFNPDHLKRGEMFFVKHGPKTVFLARFVPMLRMIAAYLAGINKMPARTFFLYNLLGGVAWALVMGSVGFFFGKNLHIIEVWIRNIGVMLAVILVLGATLFWLNRRWRRSEADFWFSRTGAVILMFQQLWQHTLRRGRSGIAIYGLVLLACGWLFASLTDDWLDKEPELYRMDHALTEWLHGGISETPLWIEGIGLLGDLRVLLLIGLGVAGWKFARSEQQVAVLTLLNLLGAIIVGLLFQLWLKRPLPPSSEQVWQLTAYAFPYLPSLMSVVIYGWMAYLWGENRAWGNRVNAGTITGFVIISVSLFGLYIGQARLSDVLAGLMLGVLWLGLLVGFKQWQANSVLPEKHSVLRVKAN